MVATVPIHRGNVNDQRQSLFCSVPQEVLLENILSRLNISEIGKLKLTCKSLSVLTDHPLLFKHLLKRNFQKIETESKCKSTYQHFHKVHQNILKGNYHLTELKELTSIRYFKIENDLLIGSIGDTLHIWNLNMNQCIKSLKAHEKDISCLEVQDGKIYTGSSDLTCRIWDLETTECLHVLKGHTGKILQMKIIEKKMITGSLDQTCKIWDLETKKCLHTLGGYGSSITCLSATNDIVIAFSYKAGVSIRYCCQGWSMHSGECLYKFEGKGAIASIEIFDNAFITADSIYNYKCEMRDLKTGKLKQDFPSEFLNINCLEIADDLVVFGGQNQWKSWNRKTGEIVASEKSTGHIIGTMQISQGKVFTICYWSKIMKIWDLKTGKCFRTFHLQMRDLEKIANSMCYLGIKEGKVIISTESSSYIWDFSMN